MRSGRRTRTVQGHTGCYPAGRSSRARSPVVAGAPDGRYYVFGVPPTLRRREDLWLLPERRGLVPLPAAGTCAVPPRGPLTFHAPLAFSPDGQTLFLRWREQLHGELMRSDPATHQAVPYLSGISATEEGFRSLWAMDHLRHNTGLQPLAIQDGRE